MSLEGLRAVAIIAIVFYHLSVSWLPSGHLGVVLFLVLSGYLASASILRALRREGLTSVPKLWLKRVVRIWPPMVLMIIVTVAACALFNHILLTKLRPDLLPSLLFANNLGAIIRGASYFDNLGGTSPLTHLWYLGIDMQFFVVWSVLAGMLCTNGRPNRLARMVALALALVSAILMAVLYDPNGDPTRVYYGLDTRAFAPLLGAWLGLAWPLGGRPLRLDAARHTVRSVPLVLLGPIALAGLVVMMVLCPNTSPFLYRGGMLLASLLSVVLIAGCLETKSPLARILSQRPFTWIGEHSFGIYLWHFPLFQLFRVTRSDTSPLLVILAVVLSVVLSDLSLRFVEQPISQGRIPFIPRTASGRRGTTPNYLAWVPAGALALILAGGVTGLAIIPEETAVPEGAIKSTGEGAATAVDLSSRKREVTDDDSSSSSNKDSDDKSSKDKDTSSSKKKTTVDKTDVEEPIVLKASSASVKKGLYTPIVIADSVAGDAAWCFEERIPDGFVDSYVGRQPSQAVDVLEQYIDQGVVGDIVVLASFSNMPATESDLNKILKLCEDRTLFIVNVRIPETEEEQINNILAKFAKNNDNVELIDWHSYSDEHDNWFYADATHLDSKGQEPYVNLITHAIAEKFEESGGEVLTEDEAEEKGVTAGKSLVVDPSEK